MENRNVKVIDEHGIDRDANVVCTLGIDGNEYVLYWIGRDNDNDNLFVSKLTKNNDGTSNMVNIEDNMEKVSVSDAAKELITYSINNEADKTTGTVKLNNGKEVTIGNALFNKEQNINVSKTYITTVKKNVTKVSQDFYKVEKEVPSVSEVKVENVFEPVVSETPSSEPAPAESVALSEPVVEPIIPTEVVPETAAVVEETTTPEPEVAVEPILPVAAGVTVPSEPVSAAPVIEPILPVPGVAAPESAPVEAPVNDKVEEVLPPVGPTVSTVPVDMIVNETPAVQPEVNPGLVFDGTKETNLNAALGEVTTEGTVPVQDVSSIREFGQNSAVVVPPVVNTEVAPQEAPVPATPANATGGFANNKFLMVIAIVLFVGACVFLGYEAFRYFQLVK